MKQLLGTTLVILFGALVIAVGFLLITGAVQRADIPFVGGEGTLAQRSAPIFVAGPANGISVNGEGLVKTKADIARTQVSVDVTNTNVVEAQRDAATRMDRVLAKLKELGVAADDIKTVQYSLTPQYDYGQGKTTPLLVGYRVNNSVAVTIRQLDKVGTILDAVTVAGATSLQGVTYTIADPTPLQSQARAAAVKQARTRAEELAKAAGVSLGKVTTINESTAGATPTYAASVSKAMGLEAAQTPISPGELEIRVNVQVNYAIQ